ncbi:hypothetical protein JT209_02035 [Helicobacter pylori]|nr:hypothetical protein [Helicobacter pylori]
MLREFVASIDAKVQEEKQTGKPPTKPERVSYQEDLNKFLAPWGYACKISLGSWDLSYKPSIAFCRQDILGERFVNGEKPTPTKGFYIWFAYCWCERWHERENAKKFYLRIGLENEKEKEKCQKCLAYNKIADLNDGYEHYRLRYDDLESDLENITNDFLRFANEFNQIPTAYFELEPSASH